MRINLMLIPSETYRNERGFNARIDTWLKIHNFLTLKKSQKYTGTMDSLSARSYVSIWVIAQRSMMSFKAFSCGFWKSQFLKKRLSIIAHIVVTILLLSEKNSASNTLSA